MNKALAFTFSNISIPPMIPFIIYGSMKVGSIFIDEQKTTLIKNETVFNTIKDNLLQYVVGSLFFF